MAGPMHTKTAPSTAEKATPQFKTQPQKDSKVRRTEKTIIPKSAT